MKKILLVEKNNAERLTLCNYLSAEYDITEVRSSAEALLALHSENVSYAAVILDLFFTDNERVKLLSEIKNAPEYKHLPIIILTLTESDCRLCELLATCADGFIKAPYNKADVLFEVKRVLTAESSERKSDTPDDFRLISLNDITENLLEHDTEHGINDILKKLAKRLNGDRAFVLEFDTPGNCVKNTYEFCFEKTASIKNELQALSLDFLPFFTDVFQENKYVYLESTKNLITSRREISRFFSTFKISSFAAAPIIKNDGFSGIVAVCNIHDNIKLCASLPAIAAYISSIFIRRNLTLKLDSERNDFLTVMNDIPGGFVRFKISKDGTASPDYVSDSFRKLTGMSRDTSREISSYDALCGVHPDDLGMAKKALAEMAKTGTLYNFRHRLLTTDGGFVRVVSYGNKTVNAAGDVFLNIYYTDVTNENSEEEFQIELLDNLPIGAALYEFDGKNLNAVHHNKRYWDQVKRNDGADAEQKALENVHPDDLPMINNEFHAALKQNRDFACDARILVGSDSYSRFHISGTIIPDKNGNCKAYASFIPITNDNISLREMLPIMLSGMTANSDNYTFVKSRDLKYICCNEAASKILGLDSPRDIIGKDDFELFGNKIAKKYRADDLNVINSGNEFKVSKEPVISKARHGYTSYSKYPLRDAEDNVIGVFCIGRDVSIEKDNESRLKLLAENINGGLASFRFSRDKIETIYYNDGFFGFSGYNREEYEKITSDDPLHFIFEEDRQTVLDTIEHLRSGNIKTESCIYRCHTKYGGFRWFSLAATVSEVDEDSFILNVVQFDITTQKETEQKLAVKEEEYRLAALNTENTIARYNIADRTLTLSTLTASGNDVPEVSENIPYSAIENGNISADTTEAYIGFYEKIINGDKNGYARFRRKLSGEYVWLEAHFSTIFSADGTPVSAIISFKSIAGQVEKEAIYKKWQQSMAQRDPSKYILFHFKLDDKNSGVKIRSGQMHHSDIGNINKDAFHKYVEQYVFSEDRDTFVKFVSIKTLRSNYYRGKRNNLLNSVKFRRMAHCCGYALPPSLFRALIQQKLRLSCYLKI